MTKDINPKLIPEVNIGIVGHVSHGKTTLVQALTGKSTLTHSEELKRGITIRLGYADATIYRCKNCGKLSTENKCPYCLSDTEAVRTVSLIDAPGHETLMATVLSGASLMDGALLIIAANEKCPQPQTREHLTALEIVGIKNVIIVQTKVDLVTPEEAKKNYDDIKKFVKGSALENSPIIPVAAQQKVNLDAVLDEIEKIIPTPQRDESLDPLMYVARSFDINKPGAVPEKLIGGILGGSIVRGKLKVGDKIEVSPGVQVGGKYQKLVTKITGLQKAGMALDEAKAGGLLGILTDLDPSLTKSDSLVGNVAGISGKLPQVRDILILKVKLLERIVGAENSPTAQIKLNENILLNVGTARTVGLVTSLKKDLVEMKLKLPIAVDSGERVAISRQISGRWRLTGYGSVQ